MSATRPICELPPPVVAGLTMPQRKCLVAAAKANGLVLIEGWYRTGYRVGAARFRQSTVRALISCGLLMQAGESLAKVTPDGAIEAERSIAVLLEAANKELADAGSRALARHRIHNRGNYWRERRRAERASTTPADLGPEDLAPQWRKPYAD